MTNQSDNKSPKWTSWLSCPPQLQAPVLLTYGPSEHVPVIVVHPREIRAEANAMGLVWRPSGLYRQEFFDVSGRWI